MISRVGRPVLSETAFFLCDVQERFRPLIHHFDTVAFNSNLLVSAAKLLEIPVLATEQYSRAFGHTVPEIQLDDVPVFEKRKFSMLTEEVSEHFASLGDKKTVVLFGIESHVCVLQTCLELLDQGTEVHLVYDAVSSQRRFEREMAIERMTKAGAFVNSTEGIVFQLMGDSTHPQFRAISSLFREQHEHQIGFETDIQGSLGEGKTA